MSPIKDFHLVYNVPNSEETFSEGGVVGGTVSFAVTKESKVKSILVKLKGDASVSWEEGMGDDTSRYSDHRRYFKVKNYLVAQNEGGGCTLEFSCLDFPGFCVGLQEQSGRDQRETKHS